MKFSAFAILPSITGAPNKIAKTAVARIEEIFVLKNFTDKK